MNQDTTWSRDKCTNYEDTMPPILNNNNDDKLYYQIEKKLNFII